MSEQYAIVVVASAASNYSAAVDMLASDVGLSNGSAFYPVGAAVHRVQLRVGTAAFLSLITKLATGTVLGSGMLLPQTGSVALTINTMYNFNHQIQAGRVYNYQLSAATTLVDMTVHQVHSPLTFG